MKKVYSKPDIAYEDFSLSSSIAYCDIKANFRQGDCGYSYSPGIVFFSNNVAQCNIDTDEICYDNPSGMTNLFGS